MCCMLLVLIFVSCTVIHGWSLAEYNYMNIKVIRGFPDIFTAGERKLRH